MSKSKATASKAPAPAIAPRLLTIRESAFYLSATVWFIRSKIWSGELPALTLGKRLVVDKVDLDRFVEKQKAVA